MITYRKDCPCCGGRRLERLDDYAHTYLCQCGRCDFVFAGKVPSDEELEAHYAHKYENKYNPDAWVSETTRKRLDELVAEFEPYRQNNRLLDVGCGRGLFLEAADKAGWDSYGTEYSEDAIRYGRERGFEMHEGEVTEETYPEGHFDVIVMTEVIEHVPEPRDEMAKVAAFLRPGGLLYMTTPNFDSMSRRVLKHKWNVIEYPAHLSYFTVPTLSKMLGELGLDTVKADTTGFSPTRFRKSLMGQEHLEISPTDADEIVRNALESRSALQRVKGAINLGLSVSRLGDVLKLYLEKS